MATSKKHTFLNRTLSGIRQLTQPEPGTKTKLYKIAGQHLQSVRKRRLRNLFILLSCLVILGGGVVYGVSNVGTWFSHTKVKTHITHNWLNNARGTNNHNATSSSFFANPFSEKKINTRTHRTVKKSHGKIVKSKAKHRHVAKHKISKKRGKHYTVRKHHKSVKRHSAQKHRSKHIKAKNKRSRLSQR